MFPTLLLRKFGDEEPVDSSLVKGLKFIAVIKIWDYRKQRMNSQREENMMICKNMDEYCATCNQLIINPYYFSTWKCYFLEQ